MDYDWTLIVCYDNKKFFAKYFRFKTNRLGARPYLKSENIALYFYKKVDFTALFKINVFSL